MRDCAKAVTQCGQQLILWEKLWCFIIRLMIIFLCYYGNYLHNVVEFGSNLHVGDCLGFRRYYFNFWVLDIFLLFVFPWNVVVTNASVRKQNENAIVWLVEYPISLSHCTS